MSELKARKPKYILQKPSLLIICEDKTIVPKYFKKLEDKYQNIITLKYFHAGTKLNAPNIVKTAIRELEIAKNNKRNYAKNLEACCIFDKDQNTNQELTEAIRLSKKHGISCYISNPCFEIWFLNHYTYSDKPFKDGNEVIDELKEKSYAQNYDKKERGFSSDLQFINYLIKHTKTACNHSERQINYHLEDGKNSIKNQNPGTQNYLLIKKIENKISEEKIKAR